jgi:2-polyprenyl-3-methyl-5-hydroxy-6-metoxy-1,4-benzoquinol methylase
MTTPPCPQQSNAQTIASYEAHVPAYIAGTAQEVSGPAKDWIDAALDGLAPGARLLELGSAFGRDARYIMGRGYRLECSDATQGFIEHLRAQGFTARRFNALTDELDHPYDLIIANAVLLHFTRAECAYVLAKLAAAVRPGGRCAFSLKQGDGEEISTMKLNAPRYFCYWQPGDLPEILRAAGFAGWDIATANTDRKHAQWIYVIAHMAG